MRPREEIQNAIDILRKKAESHESHCDVFEVQWRIGEQVEALSWVLGERRPLFEEKLLEENQNESGSEELKSIQEHLDVLAGELHDLADVMPDNYNIRAAIGGISLAAIGLGKWLEDDAQKDNGANKV